MLLLAVAVPVMVGLFPPAAPSPFGRLLSGRLRAGPGGDRLPHHQQGRGAGRAGLRAVLAVGAAELFRGAKGERPWRGAAAAGVAVILAVSVLPAWTSGLYPIRYQVPGYWHELAADVNAGPGDTRVLLAPEASNTAYRWGMEGPDDVNLSLSQPSVVRTICNGSFEQTNFLAALDLPLSTGDADPRGEVAAMARYLGVAEVVSHNDQRWETFGEASALGGGRAAGQRLLARPGRLLRPPWRAHGGPGLRLLPARPGAGGRGPAAAAALRRGPAPADPADRADPGGDAGRRRQLRHRVAGPPGLAPGEPAFPAARHRHPGRLAASLAGGARVVVSDSNRRRAWGSFRTGQNYSPTLRASQPCPPPPWPCSATPTPRP